MRFNLIPGIYKKYDIEIGHLALPNIITNISISIPVLGSIDLAIVGHLGSEVYIGAVALGTMIFNLIYWGFGFLRMSTSGYTAQAFGKQDFEAQQKMLFQGMIMAMAISAVILLLQTPIEQTAFYFIDAGAKSEKLAAEYFYIRIWAAPATLSLYVLSGWLLGMQNAKIPMLIAIIGSLLNTLFSYLLVYYVEMNVNGVAAGTVIAQYLSFIIAIIWIKKRYPKFFKGLINKAYLKKKELLIFFKLNTDIFVRTLCIIAVFSFFTSSSAARNDEILALNTLLMQFFMFFSYFEDGFAYAAEAIVGKYIGKDQREELIISVKRIFFWGFVVSLLFSFIYYLFSGSILSLLTNQPRIIASADEYFVYIMLIPVISFASFLWDGIYIGATASKEMRNTMLLSTLLIYFPTYYLSNEICQLGNHSIWISLLLFVLARGISQTILAYRYIKKEAV